MDTPKFSFVMPAYKRKFLADTITSILNQTFEDFELIIVDDASPENLYEVVKDFSDSRLRYERNEENLGGKNLVANWNHCLQFAHGEFVVLATDDDVLAPTYLEDAALLIARYPKIDLVRQGVRKISSTGAPLEFELFPKKYLDGAEFAYFWGCCGLISCIPNFLFRRTALIQRGGFVSFPHAHYSDVATALAMSSHGVACVQKWNVGFRMSEVNLSNRTDYHLALDQIQATNNFLAWLEHYLEQVDDFSAGRFYATRAFQGFRNQYFYMMRNLIGKIPRSKMWKAIGAILDSRYVYKKEKLMLIGGYFVG